MSPVAYPPWDPDTLAAAAAMQAREVPIPVVARILGRTPGSTERALRASRHGSRVVLTERRCPSCGKVLCSFNPGPYCYAHEGEGW